MKNNMISEKELRSLFQHENFQLQPDPEIETRLNYTFTMKRRKQVIYQNSFTGFFSWIFSVHQISAKAVIVSLLMVFTIFNLPQNTSNIESSGTDSLKYNRPYKADTTLIFPLSMDTCHFEGS